MEFSTTGPIRLCPRRACLPVILAAAALLVAACGGTSSSGGVTPAASSGGASSSVAAAGGGATVTTHDGPLGTYLTDADGKTLYLFVADTGTTSTCTGACATHWPPLTTTGAPSGTGQVNPGSLGTTTRDDGSTQVTYAGHPLYYFAGDTAAGDMQGQGSNGSGAKWWIVAPNGNAITKAASGSGGGGSPAPSTSSGGGAGGWA